MAVSDLPGKDPGATYRQRLDDRARTLAALDSRRHRLGLPRLLTLLLAAGDIWLAIQGRLSPWLIPAPIALFVALVWWQSRIERDIECVRRAIVFYERGIARIEHRWQGGGETGERFLDPHHPYSLDLDIFGRASLFQLLSTARTRGGEAQLARWLLHPDDTATLRERHRAIDELRPMLDLREQLAVLGADYRVGVNPEHLSAWAAAPVHPFTHRQRRSALIFSILMAPAIVWWLVASFIQIAPAIAIAILGIIIGAFALSVRKRVTKIAVDINEPAHDLDLLAQILALLENRQFTSRRLSELSAAIRATDENPASKRIARLRRLMEFMDSRENFIVRIIGPPLLWTTQLAMAIEGWRAENGPHISGWLGALAEIEAISALANYAYEHPDDVFPEFAEGEPQFDAADIKHPLLPGERAVSNSVRLVPPVRLLVVSGSNMSGKSTLLRAVGVNAVLSMAGAPVRATSLRLTRLSIGASIRTTDSLEEGQSRFMAEILRLRQILELPQPAFFLLDELLHGTNSHDRAIGAEGIVRALLARNAIGLATTHDLSLAEVATQLSPAAANVHFEDRLENGRLVFDYKMREGVVTRSNALDLMRAAGLDI